MKRKSLLSLRKKALLIGNNISKIIPYIIGKREKLHSESPQARNSKRKSYLNNIFPAPYLLERTNT